MEEKNYVPELKNVSETLLVPLYFRAKETLETGKIQDFAAVEILKKIQYDFRKMSDDKDTQKLITTRTQILDKIVSEYVPKREKTVIVNLGAGLDTRHMRFDKSIKWYHLDLEKPMQLRKLFFGKDDIHITKDILDFSWIEDIDERKDVLIIIEGVSMYLKEEEVKSIFRAISSKFKNSYIAFDTIPKSFVNIKEHQSIDMKQAPFQWGNDDLSEIEKWEFGFEKVENYHYVSNNTSDRGFKVSLMRIN